MLTNYDIEDPPKIQTLYDVSEILQSFSYFNIPVPDMYTDFVTILTHYLGDSLPTTERGSLIKLKFVIMRFLRYQMLFPSPQGDQLG